MIRPAQVLTALILTAPATSAGAFDLAFPLACSLGKTCYIQQYADHDASPVARDFTCGGLSYDGHTGTDFALTTLAAMQAGVDVLAAAKRSQIQRPQALAFRAIGKKLKTASWPAGTDQGSARLMRGATEVSRVETSVEIP